MTIIQKEKLMEIYANQRSQFMLNRNIAVKSV